MEAIKIEVTGNIAKVIEKPLRITSGTVGLPVEFVFDSHWDNMTKVAVFNTGIVKKNMKIVDNATVVPIEALAVPELNLSIGVYGVSEDGSVATPTVWASVGQIRHGAVPGSSFGSDIGTAKKYYDLGEQAAEKADASAQKAESDASVAENAADRANASAKSAEASAALAGEEAEHAIIECTLQKNAAINARHYAEEAADRAEAAADRAESAGGGGTVIVALDEGNAATHTALEIYDAIQNEQTVVFHHTGRLIDEFVPLKISKPDLAVFSKAGYPTEFDIFDIEINNIGTISYNTHFSSALVNQAVEKVGTELAPVSYLPQELNPEQQAQARENIGAAGKYAQIEVRETDPEEAEMYNGRMWILAPLPAESPFVYLPRCGIAFSDGNVVIVRSSSANRMLCVSTNSDGIAPAMRDTVENDVLYYPIAVPNDATSVTINCGTLYWGFNGLNVVDGAYIRGADPGWKASGVTVSLETGADKYAVVIFRKSDNSEFEETVDTSNFTITFA